MSKQSSKTENSTSAGVFGASGGTLLVAIAGTFNDTNPLKKWLPLIAPSLSVVASLLWFWVQASIVNYWRGRREYLMIQQTVDMYRRALDDPNSTQGFRDSIRKHYQDMQLEITKRNLTWIKSTEYATVQDIRERENEVGET